jgi:radical SAM protein with 4Fe4S-binding SPASM domain
VVFQVSLDGATAEVHDAVRGHGSFGAVIKGIRLLQEHGAANRVEICRMIVGQPDKDFDQLVELGERLAVGGIRLLALARLGRAEASFGSLSPTDESYREFYRKYFQFLMDKKSKLVVAGGIPGLYLDVPEDIMWCHVGEMLEVDPQGTIYPCSMLAHPEFKLGTIWEMTLQQAAECDRMTALCQVLEGRTQQIEACRKCAFKHFCQTGCPGMSLVDRGTLFAEDSLCQLRKELFEELFFEVLPRLDGLEHLSSRDIQI